MYLVEWLQGLEPSVSGGDDVVWLGLIGERLGILGEAPIDGRLKIDDRMEDAIA